MVYNRHPGNRAELFEIIAGAIWSLGGACLAILFPHNAWQAVAGLLMMNQAFCGVLFRSRLRATPEAVLPDFLTVYLLVQFVRKSLTVIALIVSANGESVSPMNAYLLI